MIISIILAIAAAIIMCSTVILELKRDLMMFQQNSYRASRYRTWLSTSKDSTSLWRLTALVILFISLSTFAHPYATIFMSGVFGIACTTHLYGCKYKKPLAWTARATRIYSVACLLTAGIAVASWFICPSSATLAGKFTAVAIGLLAVYCASHIIIILANLILSPVEYAIGRHYYNDAAARLRSMPDLRIIGITGSYGKTSTKHYLYRILSEQFDTLMTPGSFNTTLGVVRTIREYLKPYNEIFIVEMGAKNIGDIKEICDLVHPTMGIITAVGPQHLESFKTIENVQATKFELADALPSDGVIIVNDDFPQIASREVSNCRCERYGIKTRAPWRATDIHYGPDGTDFRITGPDNFELSLHTRLMGEANVSDLLAAVVCAVQLGVNSSKIKAAVASIEPVEHRLSVKRTPGGVTILDDAFNSNPVGSRMALEVLGTMRNGKRIVITPGMIELGAEQYELNMQLGQTIADNVDIAIVVGKYNRDAIAEGIRSKNFPNDRLHLVDSFNEAQSLLVSIAAKGDTVLYENDLPDTFK